MKMRFSPKVEAYLARLKRTDFKTFKLVFKQLDLFETSPNHPSLRTHQLSGKLKGVMSISIGRKLRLLYFVKNNEAWGYQIETHDEVYRK